MEHLTKPRMFAPGPTPLLPEGVLQAVMAPTSHRKEDFRAAAPRLQKSCIIMRMYV